VRKLKKLLQNKISKLQENIPTLSEVKYS